MYSNPTPIKIGMEGAFAGKTYRVAGRVVLGIVEDGEIYYWNEFNLETDAGDVATLVYEDGDNGPEWKMFTMFEPQFAISAEDAATKRTGDLINLDGTNCRVTRVDHSRVYFVEGKAQEGEVVNAAANYFNAVEAGRMIVVSWTGDEVECYRGMTVTSGMVASAFGLQKSAFPLETGVASRFRDYGGQDSTQPNPYLRLIVCLALGLILFTMPEVWLPTRRGPAFRVFTAPSSSFELSGEGMLNGTTYRISARAVAEWAEVGLLYRVHEYFFTNDAGGSALLIQGLPAGTKNWVLFTPLSPVEPMTPVDAAKVVAGHVVNVDGVVVAVTDLFRSKVIGGDEASWGPATGNDARYGFLGRKNKELLMVRWNVNEIIFRKGTAISESEVRAGFGKAAGK